MESKKTTRIYRNIVIIVCAFIVTIIASIFISKPVDAMVRWNGSASGGRPTFSIVNYTGLFPQMLSERNVTVVNDRYNTNTNKWIANISSGTVYCADQGKILRNGKFDSKTYYIPKDYSKGVYYSDIVDLMRGNLDGELGKKPTGNQVENINKHYIGDRLSNKVGAINIGEKVYYTNQTTTGWGATIANGIFSNLKGEDIPQKYSPDIDSVKTYDNWTEAASNDGRYGPKVCVMETSDRAENGYRENSSGTYYSKAGGINARASYILTALENMYGENGSKKYNEEDIQTAYWMLVDTNLVKLTQNGQELFRKSGDYEKFVNETKDGFNSSIDSSNAKVIANRNSKEYIVGPLKLNYPDYTDISYVKSMYITTADGKRLVIDEKNQDFDFIFSAGGTNGSNGLTKSFPKSGENFFIKFSAEKVGYATQIELNADFEYVSNISINYKTLSSKANIYQYKGYIDTEGTYAKNQGSVSVSGYVTWTTQKLVPGGHKYLPGCTMSTLGRCDLCGENPDKWETENHKSDTVTITKDIEQPYVKMDEAPESTDTAQPLIAALDGSREYVKNKISKKIDISMKLGGKVWEDSTGGKETIGNNIKDESDKPMPNVTVNLYRQDGQHIGTTKTDSNGTYLFSGLNAMYQYYVKFTYNGQYYQPVNYQPASTWGSKEWSVNSNGTDKRNERLDYNAKFASIGSSPANYKSGEGYNETFTKLELLGYTLATNGEYTKTREAVIDDYGNLILGSSSDARTQKMIQFVKDCQIDSYTGKGDGSYDLYPVPAVFVIDNVIPLYRELLGWNISVLYDSAYYINQGYVQREKSDLTLKKDIEKVSLEINGQTHTYTYDTLENKPNAEGTWDISVRLSDAYYNAKYSRELYTSDYLYKVSIYGEDPEAYGKYKKDELEVYVTYKVMVRNQSQSIRCRVDEIVDYYDKDYEYVENRSYITFKSGDRRGQMYNVKGSNISKYNELSGTTTKLDGYDNLYIGGLGADSQKIDNTGKNIENPVTEGLYLNSGETAYVYLTFKIKKDTADGEDWVKLDEEVQSAKAIGVGKENIVEINGYSTLYKDGTEIPNVGKVNENEKAGIIDKDSNPGNLNPSDVPKDGAIKYENFEDDTDKAPNIRIILNRDPDAVREITGVVWEDERDESIGATTTGDGKRTDKETLINGVTVQLVELMENGTEFIWREFGDNAGKGTGLNTIGKGTGSGTVDSETPIINAYNLIENYKFEDKHDGAYAFKSFTPGKYVVRFIYGDTEKTVLTKDINTDVNKTLGKAGLNNKSYNGQDFKSTTYQEGIVQNNKYAWREKSTWENGQETLGKILTEVLTFKQDATNNETANAKLNELKAYLYDITASDKIGNVSDAKDIESIRNKVIDYSDDNITNHIAEVLASYRELPTYQNGNYNKTQLQSLIDELINRTKMTSETGLMIVEFEYDRTGTGDQADSNKTAYKVKNVDLGLEERPKSQLAVDKEITNVKITLADGSILFDAKSTATNVLWKDHKPYNLGYKGNVLDPDKFGNIVNIRNKNASKFGLIQLSMDEELMHGATIRVDYNITVSNVGEVDYKDNKFYYTGNVGDTKTIVTTKANQVIDYVANNLQFNAKDNSNWKTITKEELLSNGLVNTELVKQIEQHNTIIITEDLGKALVPNLYKDKIDKNSVDNVNIPLVLTQLITSENETDDLTYRNIVEIVKTSNNVGRKNEYSVVGNQDPTKEPQELDSDRAEVVKILPPFGNNGLIYIISAIALASVVIIIGGIVFIKKKVLNK